MINEVISKLTYVYVEKITWGKLNLRVNLHGIQFREPENVQEHRTYLESTLVSLANLINPVEEMDIREIQLRSFSESSGFLVLVGKANHMNYDLVYNLLH